MRVLLDTHAIYWYIEGDSQLSATAQTIIQDASTTPALKQLYETHGRDGRITFVGVNLDYSAETAAEYVAGESIAWPQLATGSWGDENAVLREFAVTSAPSFWIIGPDGTVVARDIAISDLARQIEATVRAFDRRTD